MIKTHSDNLRIIAGFCAVRNLNVFDDEETSLPTLNSFRQAMYRSWVLAERAITASVLDCSWNLSEAAKADPVAHWGKVEGDLCSLASLSIPALERRPENKIALVAGRLLWGGYLFLPGAEFTVTDAGLSIHTPQLAARARAVPATVKEVEHDSYNGDTMAALPKDVMRELNVFLSEEQIAMLDAFKDGDQEILDEAGEFSFASMKFLSVYAPAATAQGPQAIVVAYDSGAAPDESVGARPMATGFDTKSAANVLAKNYDRFWMTFVSRDSAFGYITVESMSLPKEEGGPLSVPTQEEAEALRNIPLDERDVPDRQAYHHIDSFGERFDKEHAAKMREIGGERLIGELEALADGRF